MPSNSQTPLINIHHPTSYPTDHHLLLRRLTAIHNATSAHNTIRAKLLSLKTECKDSLTDIFLHALERELARVARVLGDFSVELTKVTAELEALERKEAMRVCVEGKEEEEKKGRRRRCF